MILQAVVENYEEYKDFNATTTASDYGDSLYILARLPAPEDELRASRLALPPGGAGPRRAGAARPDRGGGRLGGGVRPTAQEPAAQHLEELARLEREHRVRLATVGDRLREGFVKPLALDRLCALIEPAVHEARQSGERPAFERLRRELHPFTATPTGAGLDVPQWLRRLEGEVQRVRATHSAVAVLAEGLFRAPQRAGAV